MTKDRKQKFKFKKRSLFVLMLIALFLFWGCKEEKTDDISQLEQCKIYMDESEWDDAIDACEGAGGDEGYHLAAQAYLAKGGFSIYNLILTLRDNPSSIASVIFNFVPDSTSDTRTDFVKALNHLMGSNIATKDQLVHLEGILASTVLILSDLKDVFGLDVSGDGFSTCDFDATSGPTKCSFDATVDASPKLTFSGFGTTFYDHLCSDSDTSYDGTDYGPPQYDVTVDSCVVQTGSIFAYHKAAHTGFDATGDFVDASGDSIFDIINFYNIFDSGSRGEIGSTGFFICNSGFFSNTDVTADDDKINDCEIFGALTDPSSDLFG